LDISFIDCRNLNALPAGFSATIPRLPSSRVNRSEIMTYRRLIPFVLLVALGGALTACGGGGAKVEAVSTTTTMGQELQDLDDAYKKGIITESEYESAKKRIIDRYKK
jgi:hypothetical protein